MSPLILDNVLSSAEVLDIERVMRTPYFPWYIQEYTASGTCVDPRFKDTPFISHSFISRGSHSSYAPLANKVVSTLEQVVEEKYKIDRAIGAATFKSSDKFITPPHIDMDIDHKVLIYYVNDNDGQTIFYKPETNFEELMRVDVKAGRFVLFDGRLYHSAVTCTNSNYRIIINFNLL